MSMLETIQNFKGLLTFLGIIAIIVIIGLYYYFRGYNDGLKDARMEEKSK